MKGEAGPPSPRGAMVERADLRAGIEELMEFVHDVGGGRIGQPVLRGNEVYVSLVARDGEEYILKIVFGAYLAEPPRCTFVDRRLVPALEAWPACVPTGPFRPPTFICTPPTAEFYEVHPERVYRHGEGSLVNTVATIFAALHARGYGGRVLPPAAR